MNYDETTSTTADQRRAWSALQAVTTYPQWTRLMTNVAPLDGDELRVGHRSGSSSRASPPWCGG